MAGIQEHRLNSQLRAELFSVRLGHGEHIFNKRMDRALEHLTQVIENAWLFEKQAATRTPETFPICQQG
jgi:hypothetical protein